MRLRATLLAALAACGDDKFPVDLLSGQEVTALCERAVRCGQYTDQVTCEQAFVVTNGAPSLAVAHEDPGVVAAVTNGRAKLDPETARACIDALAAMTCDRASEDMRVWPAPCRTMITGLQGDGADCDFDAECASGRCTPAAQCPDDYSCCLGTCANAPHTVADGDPCMIDSDCALASFCTGAGCKPLGQMGDSCSSTSNCGFGLICLTSTGTGRCGAPPALGEACPDHLCGDIGQVCSQGSCTTVGFAGAHCTQRFECAPNLLCDATGACAKLPALGEACTGVCARGTWCMGTGTGVCVAPLPNGSECVGADECDSAYCAEGQFATTCIDRPVCF